MSGQNAAMSGRDNVVSDRRRVHHFVDGQRITTPPTSTHTLAPVAIDHGRNLVPIATPDEVEAYLERCSAGLARWIALGRERRAAVLRAGALACRRATLDLAAALADDLGQPCADTVNLVRWTRDTRDPSPLGPASDRLGLHVVLNAGVPLGPQAFDATVQLLLNGSIVVIHPPLHRPRAATVRAEILSEAGMPDGVFNVIHGDHDTTAALLASPHTTGTIRFRTAAGGSTPVDGAFADEKSHAFVDNGV